MNPPAHDERGRLIAALNADLRRHAELGSKRCGSVGDSRTADWIADRLSQAGFHVVWESLPVPVFAERTARLTAGTASAQVMPQPPVVPTDALGLAAPLAVIRHEFEAGDARDCIALVVPPHGRHAVIASAEIGPLVKAVAAAEARAVVIITTGPTGETIGLNVDLAAPFVPIPTALLAPNEAVPFLRAARAGATGTLVLDGDAEIGTTVNLVARIERGPRWLAFSTPRTGWFDCVGERGTGTAAFLEITAWAARTYPDLSIFALNSGGHEFLGAGTRAVLHHAPLPKDTMLWTHFGASLAVRDALELRGAQHLLSTVDPQRIVMATDSMLPVTAAAFAGLSGLEQPMPVISGAGELSLITGRGYANAFAVLGIHRWFHTVEDRLDKVDARLLAPVVEAHRRSIETAVRQEKKHHHLDSATGTETPAESDS